MRIKIEMSAKGMLHHDDKYMNTVCVFDPLLYRLGSECGQIVEQMAVLLKDWPENVWHRKDNPDIGNIGKGGPLLPLPQ